MKIADKYRRVKARNQEEFLAKIGANFLAKKTLSASTPTIEFIDMGGGKWKQITATTMKTVETEIDFNQPFNETTITHKNVNTTMTRESYTRWIKLQKDQNGGKDVKVIFDFKDDGIDIQYICEDVVSKQFFART